MGSGGQLTGQRSRRRRGLGALAERRAHVLDRERRERGEDALGVSMRKRGAGLLERGSQEVLAGKCLFLVRGLGRDLELGLVCQELRVTIREDEEPGGGQFSGCVGVRVVVQGGDAAPVVDLGVPDDQAGESHGDHDRNRHPQSEGATPQCGARVVPHNVVGVEPPVRKFRNVRDAHGSMVLGDNRSATVGAYGEPHGSPGPASRRPYLIFMLRL